MVSQASFSASGGRRSNMKRRSPRSFKFSPTGRSNSNSRENSFSISGSGQHGSAKEQFKSQNISNLNQCSGSVANNEKSTRMDKDFRGSKKSRGKYDFNDYTELSQRLAKSMYYAKKMPSTPRPSFPLTVLAVNAFTSTTLGTNMNTLEFLDLDLASDIGINACVSPTALIMSLVYLERLYSHNPSYLSSIKPSELFVISLLVASKFIQDDGEDCGIYNDEWATSARMETEHVNRLEIEFLTAIDWNVNVPRQEFDKMLQNLELQLAKQEVQRRGWFTYNELVIVSRIATWNLIWPVVYEYAVKVIVAASITYATLVTTLFTSIVIPQMIQTLAKSVNSPSLSTLHPLESHTSHDIGKHVLKIGITSDDLELPIPLTAQQLEDLIAETDTYSRNGSSNAYANAPFYRNITLGLRSQEPFRFTYFPGPENYLIQPKRQTIFQTSIIEGLLTLYNGKINGIQYARHDNSKLNELNQLSCCNSYLCKETTDLYKFRHFESFTQCISL